MSNENSLTGLLTISQIADKFEEPPQRVAYIIRKHRISPTSKVALVRLYDKVKVQIIKQGLFNMQIRG